MMGDQPRLRNIFSIKPHSSYRGTAVRGCAIPSVRLLSSRATIPFHFNSSEKKFVAPVAQGQLRTVVFQSGIR
jgi:hypothetical protein